MTQAPKEYIITEKQMQRIQRYRPSLNDMDEYRSRPHPAPKFNSTELILLAHDEWKRREERKHLHNEQDWISGFINGFLTDPVWARKMVDTIRANAQHPITKGGEHR